MMNFKYLLVIMLGIFLAGCTCDPIIKEVIIYKPRDVYIPTPCDIDVQCEFNGLGYIPTSKLLECVVIQKKALEYCKQTLED